jgi:hypothetical protein
MAASEALTLGYGGISEVCRACGLSRKAIAKGMQEIEDGTSPPPGRVRRPGAGRKKLVVHDPLLLGALERLIDPETRGDPESPLEGNRGQVSKIHIGKAGGNIERRGRRRGLLAKLTSPPIRRRNRASRLLSLGLDARDRSRAIRIIGSEAALRRHRRDCDGLR